MRLRFSHLLAGGAVYAGATYATYKYMTRPQPEPCGPCCGSDGSVGTHSSEAAGGCGGATGCAFDRLARIFDSSVGCEERFMLIGTLRWWLLRQAQGDVLEISAGTGRNLSHYPWRSVTSLTLSDVSAPMLQRAEDKYFEEMQLHLKEPNHGRAKFLLVDAERMVAPPGAPPTAVPLRSAPRPTATAPRPVATSGGGGGGGAAGGSGGGGEEGRSGGGGAEGSVFENVWRKSKRTTTTTTTSSSSSSTTSSTGNSTSNSTTNSSSNSPTNSSTSSSKSSSSSSSGHTPSRDGPLSTFAPGSFDTVVDTYGLCSCDDPVRVLKQAAALCRPDGRLLLLEHGRSTWPWLNERIDAAAPAHRAKWGCWYNRDIEQVVRDAGLEVESCSRWHFGTTYLIVARPPTAEAAAVGDKGGAAPAAAAEPGVFEDS